MPSTLSGLVMLVVVLLPGLTYVVVRERNGSALRLSSFRETGAVVFASVIAELVVLGLFAIVRGLWPQGTPDVGRLIRQGPDYAQRHYAVLALWAVGLLLAAAALAGLAAWWAGDRQHTSVKSSWWILFDQWDQGSIVHVGCVLDDGSFIEGRVAAFNKSSDDSPDRDLILAGPIKYRLPSATESLPYAASAACVAARNITTMFVSYLPAQEAGQAPAAEGEQVGPGAGQAPAPASA